MTLNSVMAVILRYLAKNCSFEANYNITVVEERPILSATIQRKCSLNVAGTFLAAYDSWPLKRVLLSQLISPNNSPTNIFPLLILFARRRHLSHSAPSLSSQRVIQSYTRLQKVHSATAQSSALTHAAHTVTKSQRKRKKAKRPPDISQ